MEEMDEKQELAYREYLESLTVEELEALNPETSESRLRELAVHENYKVRANVANNASTPTDLFNNFAYDGHHLVRVGLVFNPNVSTDILETLGKDNIEIVRQAVLSLDS